MKNILLVDDNRYIVEGLALTISQAAPDCAVLKAKDGREAADILGRVPLDLILTDLQMPVMDGYRLIERRNEHCPQVPLLAMTADTSPAVMRKLNDLGITECLEKPFDYDAVVRMMLRKIDRQAGKGPRRPAAKEVNA